MKIALYPTLLAVLAVSACSGGGSDVINNDTESQGSPIVIGEPTDPQTQPEATPGIDEDTIEPEVTPGPEETPVPEVAPATDGQEPVAEDPVQQEPEPAPEPVTETPVTEPAPETTPDPVTEEEDEPQPQDPPLTPEEDETSSLVGYYKMTDVYNGATVLELPRRDFLGMQTTTFVIISSINEDGTITTGLLDIRMSEDGVFYAKPPESEVFAEYGVLDRGGELCRVSSPNVGDFMQFISTFMVTTIVDPESLPTCRELDGAEDEQDQSNSLVGYFPISAIYRGATFTESPRRGDFGIETDTYIVISYIGDDGSTYTALLETKVSEGVFYGKPPEPEVFAEYGVLKKGDQLCGVSNNLEGYEQAVFKFIFSATHYAENLPRCSDVE